MKLEKKETEKSPDEENSSEGDSKMSNNGSRKGSTESEKSKKITAKMFLGEEKISPLVRGLLSDKKNEDDYENEKDPSEAVEIRAESKKFSDGLSSSGSSTERTLRTEDEGGRASRRSGDISVHTLGKKSSRAGSAVAVAGGSADIVKSTSAKVSIQEPRNARKNSSSFKADRVGMRGKLSSGSAKGRTSAKKR